MELFLMRHADAVDATAGDFARVLSDKGKKQADRMGEWLKARDIRPLFIVTSPYPRARETADRLAAALGKGCTVQPDERLGCGMPPDIGSAIIHEFGRDGRRLCLTGHAPDLDNLASHLLGAKHGAVSFTKGAIAAFDTIRAGNGGSTLKWLFNPKLL